MPHPVEIFTNCYADFGLVAALDGIESLGFSDIELSVQTFPGILDIPQKIEDLDKWDPGQIGCLQNLLAKYGLTPKSGFIFVENTDEEAFALDKIKFDVAAALDLQVVNLSVTWKQPLEVAYKIFPKILEYCEQYDFDLALELHPPLYDNAKVFWKVVNDFPGLPIKANFDTANVYYYNDHPDGPAELEKVLERLAHVHLKDSFCEPEQFLFPALGEGTVPFNKYFEILEKARYEGACSLEIEGGDEEQKTYEGKQAVMERSIAFLKQVEFIE